MNNVQLMGTPTDAELDHVARGLILQLAENQHTPTSVIVDIFAQYDIATAEKLANYLIGYGASAPAIMNALGQRKAMESERGGPTQSYLLIGAIAAAAVVGAILIFRRR